MSNQHNRSRKRRQQWLDDVRHRFDDYIKDQPDLVAGQSPVDWFEEQNLLLKECDSDELTPEEAFAKLLEHHRKLSEVELQDLVKEFLKEFKGGLVNQFLEHCHEKGITPNPVIVELLKLVVERRLIRMQNTEAV